MKERLWQALARFLSRPRIADALIRYAMRTPYCRLPSNDDPSYMARYWVFNPYNRVTNKPRWGWLCPVSIRVHHIKREDTHRHLHDHPWNARTIILKGWYVEKRESALPGREFDFQIKRAGATQALRFGEYHSIVEVYEGGTWTLFFSGKWQGVWGFKVIGGKIPWRKYLGIEDAPR